MTSRAWLLASGDSAGSCRAIVTTDMARVLDTTPGRGGGGREPWRCSRASGGIFTKAATSGGSGAQDRVGIRIRSSIPRHPDTSAQRCDLAGMCASIFESTSSGDRDQSPSPPHADGSRNNQCVSLPIATSLLAGSLGRQALAHAVRSEFGTGEFAASYDVRSGP